MELNNPIVSLLETNIKHIQILKELSNNIFTEIYVAIMNPQ